MLALADASPEGGDEEAVRQYQRVLDTFERLGDQVGLATVHSQLGTLEQDRGGPATAAITSLARQGPDHHAPPPHPPSSEQPATSRRLPTRAQRRAIHQPAADDADLVEAITSLLDQIDSTEASTP